METTPSVEYRDTLTEAERHYYDLSKDVQRLQLVLQGKSVEYNRRMKKWEEERAAIGLSTGLGAERAQVEIKIIQDMVREAHEAASELDLSDANKIYFRARKEIIEEAVREGVMEPETAENSLRLIRQAENL